MGSKRPKPVLVPELCKGCGRCIDSCKRHAIQLGDQINQLSGHVPVEIDLEMCNACGVCMAACPEPYGLTEGTYALEDPKDLYGDWGHPLVEPDDIPSVRIPLPRTEPMVIKGNYAAAVGAALAGCRHVFGYPITPSTEGAELLARILPLMDGYFVQAVSEVATINHMYGCGGAGVPCITFTSSPGMSLMLEGVSYMIGAELPGVIVNVMRGGPGLGNIGPEQGDISLLCRGLGHGNTHAIVFAPSTPQEMLDLTMEAFRLTFEYRCPVIVAADGYLGQMTGRVQLPDAMIRPGVPGWGVYGDEAHSHNLNTSIYLDVNLLERHNYKLEAKYDRMIANEQRSSTYRTDDAELLVVSCNTPARMAKGAVERLRGEGYKVGLFMPLTLWPFPIDHLKPLLGRARQILVSEASAGQLEDELRLAMSHANVAAGVRIEGLRHMGGVLPSEEEITDRVRAMVAGVTAEGGRV